MEQTDQKNKRVIDLNNEYNVSFWAHKLNITSQQLTDAILNTGSVDVAVIKKYVNGDRKPHPIIDLWNKRVKSLWVADSAAIPHKLFIAVISFKIFLN